MKVSLDLENMPAVALPEEVAGLCKVDVKTVRRWVQRGRLAALATGRGGALRITGDSILRLFGRAPQRSHLPSWHEGREGMDKAPAQGHNVAQGRGARRSGRIVLARGGTAR